MSRVRAPSKTAPKALRPSAGHGRACLNCGAAYTASQATARFCGKACRDAFDNRRKARGTILYDLLMAHNYERDIARPMLLWSKMFRAASHWRAEDEAERQGRASWPEPQIAVQKTPHLFATVIRGRK